MRVRSFLLLAVPAICPLDRPRIEPPSRRAAAPSSVQQDISFYEARVARDPFGARDRGMLAALYLARARATGSWNDLNQAEVLARASQRLRRKRNDGASAILAGALLAEHRFAEAYAVMAQVVAADSTDAVSRATLGEIALELGRYREADRLFGSVALVRTQPAIGPRYARWLELNGRSGEARALLETVRASAAGGFRTPPEQLTWFDLRIGDLAARNGRPDLAEAAYGRGLAAAPNDPRLLLGMAQVRAAHGRWPDAVPLAERSLGRLFDPMTLALLADGYAALGDTARSDEYQRAMGVAVSQQPGALHRGWALFLLDHGQRIPDLLQRARADLATRRDVYGYDLVGWALHAAGRDRDAAAFADSALSRGTRDALLYYHAGTIALAAGDTASAASRLGIALDINPWFHPTHAGEARSTLQRLEEQ